MFFEEGDIFYLRGEWLVDLEGGMKGGIVLSWDSYKKVFWRYFKLVFKLEELEKMLEEVIK